MYLELDIYPPKANLFITSSEKNNNINIKRTLDTKSDAKVFRNPLLQNHKFVYRN